MQSKIQKLLLLQEIDTFIDDLSRKKDLVPRRLLHHKTERDNVSSLVDEKKSELHDKELQRRKTEKKIEELEQNTLRYQSQLNGVKTNQEYKALLAQIDRAKAQESEYEDNLLLCMEDMEEIEASLTKAIGNLQKAQNEYRQRELEANALLARLEEGIAAKSREREEIAKGLDSALKTKYARIRRNMGGLAVATVEGEICSGCRGALPPQLINEIRRFDHLHNCQHCGRILVWNA